MSAYFQVFYESGKITKIEAENAGPNQLRVFGEDRNLIIYKQSIPEYEIFDHPEAALKSLTAHARKQLKEASDIQAAATKYAFAVLDMTVESIL